MIPVHHPNGLRCTRRASRAVADGTRQLQPDLGWRLAPHRDPLSIAPTPITSAESPIPGRPASMMESHLAAHRYANLSTIQPLSRKTSLALRACWLQRHVRAQMTSWRTGVARLDARRCTNNARTSPGRVAAKRMASWPSGTPRNCGSSSPAGSCRFRSTAGAGRHHCAHGFHGALAATRAGMEDALRRRVGLRPDAELTGVAHLHEEASKTSAAR